MTRFAIFFDHLGEGDDDEVVGSSLSRAHNFTDIVVTGER